MSYQPGDCVSVDAYLGAIRHVGIVTDAIGADGFPRVISSSQKNRGVYEEDWAEFAAGAAVYPILWYSEFSGAETVRRARERLGRDYHPTAYNCEHYVRDVYGLEVKSPQARRAGYVLLGTGIVALGAFFGFGGGE